MRKYLFTLLVSMCFHFGYGQSAFSLVDSLVVLEKTIDFENLHWYGEIVNVADTSEISMKWKLRTPNGIPALWETNFDPGTNELLYVSAGDSSRFTLFKEQAFLQKLIIGVFPNGEIGRGRFEFDVFPLNNPTDLKTQIFDITFKELSAIEEPSLPQELLFLSSDGFVIKEILEDFMIYALDGRLLYSSEIEYPGLLDLRNNQALYFVSFLYEEEQYMLKFIDIR